MLLVLLFLVFQAVFRWAAREWPGASIEAGIEQVGQAVTALLPAGLLRSLLVDGVVAGAGGVLVFRRRS